MVSEKTVTLPDGSKAYVDSQPSSCGLQEIFGISTYDKHCPLRQGMVVVDAGACVGMFTLKAAKLVGDDGVVVAVEPHAEAFYWLSRNVALNRCGNVFCVNVALWNHVGAARLSVGWLGATSLVKDYNVSVAYVGTVTLNYLRQVLGLQRFDFLKIDTEGAEPEILEAYVPDKNVFIALEAHGREEQLKPLLEAKGLTVLVEPHAGASAMMYATNRRQASDNRF